MKNSYGLTHSAASERAAQVRRVLLITLTLNLIISGAKVFYGYYISSVSITSDGYHSLFDSFSNVVGLIGIYHASHPPDKEHPYGHRKYETVFTIFIAVLMFMACVEIFKSVYEGLLGRHEANITTQSFIVMLATLAVNIFVTLYEKRMAIRLESEYLLADVEHTKSDIYATVGVLAGLVFIKLGFPSADTIVGALVGLLVAKAGIDILKEATEILVDRTQADTAIIMETAGRVPGVIECHEVRTRGSKGHIFVDLHVLVNPSMTVGEAHRISDIVEEEIKKKLPEIIDVVVHIEPFEG